MATTMTQEEYEQIKRNMKEYRERVKADPNGAKRALHAAGIITLSGRLKKPYRSQ
jgi:hypothetical protein